MMEAKKTANTRWNVDEDSLLRELTLTADEKRIARERARDLLEALAQLHPDAVRPTPAAAGQTLAPGAPLYIPALKLHLNVTAAVRHALIGSVGILVKLILLEHKGFVDLVEPLTTRALTTLLDQFTRLTDEQRRILDAILQLKRKGALPGYAPTSRDIAKALGITPAAVDRALKPIGDKVVRRDPKTRTWTIAF